MRSGRFGLWYIRNAVASQGPGTAQAQAAAIWQFAASARMRPLPRQAYRTKRQPALGKRIAKWRGDTALAHRPPAIRRQMLRNPSMLNHEVPEDDEGRFASDRAAYMPHPRINPVIEAKRRAFRADSVSLPLRCAPRAAARSRAQVACGHPAAQFHRQDRRRNRLATVRSAGALWTLYAQDSRKQYGLI